MNIDDYIAQRNAIQIASGDTDECWASLGVANRHITRVIDGTMPLTPGLELEIQQCLERVRTAGLGKLLV